MDGGAWWAAVHGVAKSRTRLSDFFCVCVLLGTPLMQEKEDLNSAGRIREGSEETPELGHKAGGRVPGADAVSRAWAEAGILKGVTAGP